TCSSPDYSCPHWATSGTLPSERSMNPSGSRAWITSSIFGAILLSYLIWGLQHLLIARASQHRAAQLIAVHEGPIVRVDQLTGSGRIYLVQIGPHDSSYALEDFAGWLRSKYALDVQVLQPMTLDWSSFNIWRRQFVAELLFEQLKREHRDLAAESNAYLI